MGKGKDNANGDENRRIEMEKKRVRLFWLAEVCCSVIILFAGEVLSAVQCVLSDTDSSILHTVTQVKSTQLDQLTGIPPMPSNLIRHKLL